MKLKTLQIPVIVLLFLANFTVVSAIETDNYEYAQLMEEAIDYYTTNYDSLIDNKYIGFILSQLENEKILVRIAPNNEITSIVLTNGKITEYKIGTEIPGITVEIGTSGPTIEKILGSSNPTKQILTSWKDGEITIIPRTLLLKVVGLMLSMVKIFM